MFLADALALIQQNGMDEDPVRAGIQKGHDLRPGQCPVRTAHDHVEVLHVAHDALHGREARPVPSDAGLCIVERLAVVAALVDDPKSGKSLDLSARQPERF